MYIVGQYEVNGVRIQDEDANEVTTGTATIEYFIRNSSGTVQYLDTDKSTLTSTRTTIAVTHTSPFGWSDLIQIPSTVKTNNLTWVIIHSVYGVVGSETHYVTTSDLDAVAASVIGPGASVRN